MNGMVWKWAHQSTSRNFPLTIRQTCPSACRLPEACTSYVRKADVKPYSLTHSLIKDSSRSGLCCRRVYHTFTPVSHVWIISSLRIGVDRYIYIVKGQSRHTILSGIWIDRVRNRLENCIGINSVFFGTKPIGRIEQDSGMDKVWIVQVTR